MVKRFVLKPWFLEQVETACFVKDNLVPDKRLQRCIRCRIDEPLHLPMETTFHRAKPRDEAIFKILDMGENFVFFHAERVVYVPLSEPVLSILFASA